MINTWFISDTHFAHKNILEYEKDARPFTSVEEMNETIIDRWNGVVNDRDVVYHLGDFCFGRGNIHIAGRLRGKKKLIMGNHDTYPSADYLVYFEKLYGAVFWKQCILTHIPVHNDNLGSRAFLNVHGHLHSNNVKRSVANLYELDTDQGKKQISIFSHEENDHNYFNVSCEQNNLTPIHADIILERVKEITG